MDVWGSLVCRGSEPLERRVAMSSQTLAVVLRVPCLHVPAGVAPTLGGGAMLDQARSLDVGCIWFSFLVIVAQVDPEGGITTRPEAGFAMASGS